MDICLLKLQTRAIIPRTVNTNYSKEQLWLIFLTGDIIVKRDYLKILPLK